MRAVHFGHDAATEDPVYLPLDLFKQHTIIRGMTGAMKSVFTTYLVMQIIKQTQAAVIYVDFGGDRFTFHALRNLCSEIGRRFRFLSTGIDEDWDAFDPLAVCTPLTDANIVRATNYLVTSLSLHHGEGYGKSYFGDISLLTCQETLSDLLKDGNPNPDIVQFGKRAEALAKGYRKGEVAQVAMAIKQLLPYPQLRRNADDERQVLMDRAVEKGEVNYAFLPGVLEPTTTKLGGLFGWAAVLAAIRRSEEGKEPREVFLVVDEFALVAQSRAFELLLTLARKYHIRLILLHQSSEQLRGDSRGSDLRPIVNDNTAIKLLLTSRGEDIEDLQDMSIDVEKTRAGGKSIRGLDVSTSVRALYEPRLERNDILDCSATTGDGYLVVQSGKGHIDPVRLRFGPNDFLDTFSKKRHEELSSMALPKRAGKSRSRLISKKRPISKAMTKARRKRHQILKGHVERIRQEEQWDEGPK